MIDTAASIARLTGQTITPEMARDIVDAQVELAKLRAEVIKLRWSCARGLARRPPGRDR